MQLSVLKGSEYQPLPSSVVAGPGGNVKPCWRRPLERWSAALLALVMLCTILAVAVSTSASDCQHTEVMEPMFNMPLRDFLAQHAEPLRRAPRSTLYPNMEHLYRGPCTHALIMSNKKKCGSTTNNRL